MSYKKMIHQNMRHSTNQQGIIKTVKNIGGKQYGETYTWK